MTTRVKAPAISLALLLLACAAGRAGAAANAFSNASFEMGRSFWRLDKAKGTEGGFSVDRKDAGDGEYSALVNVGKVVDWGVQFGQTMDAGERGKTYTIAALVKAVEKPVKVRLQVERSAKPWDRAAKSETVTVTKDKWTELHATFKVTKAFSQGWFAYVACNQPNSRFRVDMLRLTEGKYVPYAELAKVRATDAGVKLYDTGKPSAAPLAGGAVAARAGWTQVAADKLDHSFKGEMAFMNNRLAVVLRQKGRGFEVYSLGSGSAKLIAVLASAGRVLRRVGEACVTENGLAGVSVLADLRSRAGGSVFRADLRMGQPFLRATPRGRAASLRIEAPCRYAVLPDFFADDIVIDATKLPIARADLPSENFLLHLLGDGEAILMVTWDKPAGDVTVDVAGAGAGRVITASQIPIAKGGHVWVAVLAGQGIWHASDVAAADAGKITKLNWTAPFPAQWRVDWRRDDGLTDSWEMATQQKAGGFLKPGWFGSPAKLPANRKRWTTVLGHFFYPCWVDTQGRGHLQPLKEQALRFEGPAVIYPINRAAGTPLAEFTVVDIVRGTLGVGPCEYILDVEGQKNQYRGRATCSNRDTLNPIYKRRRQKRKRAEIERSLKEVMQFVRHIRGRIEAYRKLGREVRAYLAERKKTQPGLAKPIGQLDALAGEIEKRCAARRGKIKTPDDAQAMVDEFRRTMLDYEGRDAFAKCKKFTAAMVEIGSNQDELVGECRWAVRVLRQRAGLVMATDPRMAQIAAEIRTRSRKVLRGPAVHEGARH